MRRDNRRMVRATARVAVGCLLALALFGALASAQVTVPGIQGP
jgi:hypothetical protein